MKIFVSMMFFSIMVRAQNNPSCLHSNSDLSNEQVMSSISVSNEELLARLVLAEGISTNFQQHPQCEAQKDLIFESIAWGVMARVQMGEVSEAHAKRYGSGIRGVIFKSGQFNPAVSRKSEFSKLFLCPTENSENYKYWAIALQAARTVINKPETSPFIQLPWEKSNGISLVSHFYYPQSKQATPVPPTWANIKSTQFIGSVKVGGRELNTNCIWFFRNEKPFGIIKKNTFNEANGSVY